MPTPLIICQSIQHGNTLKVAKALAEVLGADVKKPEETNLEEIAAATLVGFGSGIYNGKHHQSLFNLVSRLENQNQKPAFIFSTASVPFKVMHKDLRSNLKDKNFNILGEFQCKGFMDYNFLKFMGGLNNGRPNEKDLIKARKFAKKLKNE